MGLPLPDFEENGVLPPGDYELTIDELRLSLLVDGKPGIVAKQWDAEWRKKLAENACVLIEELWQVGITNIFLDGSFVENKAHPGDIDGYFECDGARFMSGELEQELNQIGRFPVWTWSKSDRQMHIGKLRLPMWIQYRVELYPHLTGWPYDQFSGIADGSGNDCDFPAAFRQSRMHVRKGVVKVVR